MILACRCGNFHITCDSVGSSSPNKADWISIPSGDISISWKFLALNIHRQATGGPVKFYYCVICSAWVVCERSDHSIIYNKRLFDSKPPEQLASSSAFSQYKFLSDENISNEDSDYEMISSQAEIAKLREVGNRYLEEERLKTKLRIDNFQNSEWAKYDFARQECLQQLEVLEKSILGAFEIVSTLGFDVFPTDAVVPTALLLSPDDGFGQTEDDDPPREWRDLAPRSNDFTEADLFEASDESGNDGAALVASRESSFDQGNVSNDTMKAENLSLNNEFRTNAIPLPTLTSTNTVDRLMLSRSQPRAIPSQATYGRTAPAMQFIPGVEDDETTGHEDHANVAKAIQMLARSIVNDGTELFAHEYESSNS